MAGLGALLTLAGVVVPTRLGPIQRAWMGLAHLLSKVTTPIFMGIVFYGVIFPIGMIMRLFGHRPLRHVSPDGSHWMARPTGPEAHGSMERQF